MRLETTESSIALIENYTEKGQWAVRWDFKPKLNIDGTETGIYWYEEKVYNFIPTIEDIQSVIIEWFNKQTDGIIKHGFEWNGIQVLLNEENKFNYKAIRDEARDREEDIKKWDEEHPEIAGLDETFMDGVDANGDYVQIPVPTGRPKSLFPITLKLGEYTTPNNFYVFTTLKELKDFFSMGVNHLLDAYAAGWYKIAAFDWTPYITALEELNN